MSASIMTAADEADALEVLHASGCTDGLPVVIPTRERVERLVLASGLDGDTLLGEMGPGGGAATIEKVAINAVMAGCLPDHVPVVVAAIRALLQPEFDLGEMQSTTHSTAPLTIVNGPVVNHCDIVGGFGALGPGHRANASIGRAIRLCMMNIGDARPGVSDMALLGHPGKFGLCLAEDERSSPWEPWSHTLGYGPDDSTVTILGAEAPHSVVFTNDADDPDSPNRLLRALAAVIANTGSNNANFGAGAVAVALNPEHADVLAGAGMSRADVRCELQRLAVNTRGHLRSLNTGFIRPGDDDDPIHAVRRSDDIVLFVAGGSGLYSAVFPSWAAGAHRNAVVHELVVTGESCEIPWAVGASPE
ncbi:hypothetical protein [Ilumatobacter coccineus]|uniref:Uncharacterized protein n=1 Tax=Ilumatobacter coccineus (strain NBRC 103263 / KCTC 29153 / YM16-304) TaxID=1313172 RepID=A0A6C7EBX0_ILUCY|nr:hypothetical protein [Ilumatobacter coccineus]BAN02138.1 hypothetical protein YM304_18240 [Ilumatobacter coccineus YM16-304]